MTKVSAGLVVIVALLVAPASALAIRSAVTQDATDVTTTSATINGQILPGVVAIGYYFEYGPTAAYGTQTARSPIAPAISLTQAPRRVTYALSGLASGATYHFRVVAELTGGLVLGEDSTFTTATVPAASGSTGDGSASTGDGSLTNPIGDVSPGSGASPGATTPPPAPVLGQSLSAGATSGSIEVKVPGDPQFLPLTGSASIPTGSVVDARRGFVQVVTAVGAAGATQSATFHGGVFQVLQRHRISGLTDIVLRGGNFAACNSATPGRAKVSSARTGRRVLRSLWGSDHHGHYRTHGRRSIATVRGTVWSVSDRCDGTLTRVAKGAVSVRDLGRRRSVLLHAHEHYLARSGR
jgi:hypothetical protein